jgi:transposase InsO family protein
MARDCTADGKRDHAHFAYEDSDGEEEYLMLASEEDYKIDDAAVEAANAAGVHIAQNESDVWWIDSGASRHMTCKSEILKDPTTVRTANVFLGNNDVVHGNIAGSVSLPMQVSSGKVLKATVSNVLFVPALKKNLFSVAAATDRGLQVRFVGRDCFLEDVASGRLVGTGRRYGDEKLYRLCLAADAEAANVAAELSVWHRRLGHASEARVLQLANGLVTGVELAKSRQQPAAVCEPCADGKMHRAAISSQPATRATKRLELVHSDVCGPFSELSFSGAKFFVTFTDDHTRKTDVFFLKHKGEAFESFKKFEARASLQSGCPVVRLRTDGGGEYTGADFEAFLAARGIQHEFSAPYTPEQNGVAERKNRTLVEMARCLLRAAKLPVSFWAEAVSFANYVTNCLPTSAVPDMTPQEAWSGEKPNLSHLRTFGCRAFAHVPKNLRSKLDSKAKACLYLGPSFNSPAHRLLDLETNRLITSRDVIFDESVLGLPNQTAEKVSISLKPAKAAAPPSAIPVVLEQPVEDPPAAPVPPAAPPAAPPAIEVIPDDSEEEDEVAALPAPAITTSKGRAVKPPSRFGRS